MSRGAIKYQPFKALEGHTDALKEKEELRKKVDKPILSEDDFERINNNLVEIINENLEGTFYIYKNKEIIKIKSKVNKVLNGYLYLEDNRILITDITNIEL